MGATMQAHIEVKKNNQWHHYAAPRIDRNYKLFGLIAGVRNCPGMKPIGTALTRIPGDASFVTKVCADEYDDKPKHITVLTADDLVKLQKELYQWSQEVIPTGIDELDLEYSIFKTYINGNSIARHQHWDDMRVICWFDE